MKSSMIELCISLATVLAITLLSAGTAAAQKNTKFGEGALPFPARPDLLDSAFGYFALNSPTDGDANTAIGYEALKSDTIGGGNTAVGNEALRNNTSGGANAAIGWEALKGNTTGIANAAIGWDALFSNTKGIYNTASGSSALHFNTTGDRNTAIGHVALRDNTTGSDNIALGVGAGAVLTTGSNNIDIGNNTGVAAESNTIRIGKQDIQTSTFVGGIFGSMVTGDAVVVSSSGQLGMVMSSARYKQDIRDMGRSSEGLMKLRPVTFHYRNDPSQQRQYGLVAEEVARVYPDLVSHDSDGQVISVRYQELVPMLLNEIQKLSAEVTKDQGEINRLSAEVAQDEARRASFEQRLSALEQSLAVRDQSQTLTAALGR